MKVANFDFTSMFCMGDRRQKVNGAENVSLRTLNIIAVPDNFRSHVIFKAIN